MNNQNGRRNAHHQITQGARDGQLNRKIADTLEAHSNHPSRDSRRTIERMIALLEAGAPDSIRQPIADELSQSDPQDIANLLKHELRRTAKDTFYESVLKEHSRPSEPLSWLVKDWMPDETLTILTGAGMSGKSRIALQLAVAVATGAERFIWPKGAETPKVNSDGQQPVVFAAWETRQLAWEHRLASICANHQSEIEALSEKLHYINMKPWGGLWGAHRGQHLSQAGEQLDGGRLLLDYAADIKARLLIIDPLAAAYVGNENDRTMVRAFLSALDQWAEDHRCAILIISHLPKSDAAQSGSTDWRNGVQSVWVLEDRKDNEDDKEEDPKKTGRRTLRVDKLNEGPIPDKIKLIWNNGRFAAHQTHENNASPRKAATNAV